MHRHPQTTESNEHLQTLANAFNTNTSANLELEARVGTNLTVVEFENAFKKLLSMGWTIDGSTKNSNAQHLLRIYPQHIDTHTGQFVSSEFQRYRIEVNGMNNIRTFCQTNALDNVKHSVCSKGLFKVNNEKLPVAYFSDFDFKVALSLESTLSLTKNPVAQSIVSNFSQRPNMFRFLRRVSLVNRSIPNFRVDFSTVKSYKATHSINFSSPESTKYEIEVEVLKPKRHATSAAATTATNNMMLVSTLKRVVLDLLCGIQRTNFPISKLEQENVLKEYYRLLYPTNHETMFNNSGNKSSDFIGPNLVVLDKTNLSEFGVPSIRGDYCVTEKTDGERCLLMVAEHGRVYLLSSNMDVMFTGVVVRNERYFHSLFDGEWVTKPTADNNVVNEFHVFDVYYVNKKSVRHLPFFVSGQECRHRIMSAALVNPINIASDDIPLNLACVVAPVKDQEESVPLDILLKYFTVVSQESDLPEFFVVPASTIFEANRKVFKRLDEDIVYHDGLIYTPTLLAVGASPLSPSTPGPLKKTTWNQLFKWKPVNQTTIDFLVVTKKDENNQDVIEHEFSSSQSLASENATRTYKTLFLHVGHTTSKHGFVNPQEDVLNELFASSSTSSSSSSASSSSYTKQRFYPSNPYDVTAGICRIEVKQTEDKQYKMVVTPPNDNDNDNNGNDNTFIIEDNMVVEFRYNKHNPDFWKWEPLCIRHDKQMGNDYSTANSNWRTIHFPVTREMLTDETACNEQTASDPSVTMDVYYNTDGHDHYTQQLRTFNNSVVKKRLIMAVSPQNGTLIDMACGKAGDLFKWVEAKLSFVFGIDVSLDNLCDPKNGAFARYLSYRQTQHKQQQYQLKALFAHGDCSKNIRNSEGMVGDMYTNMCQSVFGNIDESKVMPKAAVQHAYGLGRVGFDVTSCQFALHYMFENKRTFYSFLRNVAECTKVNGHFICTCYDGKTVFDKLADKRQGESMSIQINDQLIWSVTKQYNIHDAFDGNDDSCLGFAIDVYQYSINQVLREYLVNFAFFKQCMSEYGFELIDGKDAARMRLPSGSDMFRALYHKPKTNQNPNPNQNNLIVLSPYEETIAFMCRFAVFKKVKNVNAKLITDEHLQFFDENAEDERIARVASDSIKQMQDAQQLQERLETQGPLHIKMRLVNDSSSHFQEEAKEREEKEEKEAKEREKEEKEKSATNKREREREREKGEGEGEEAKAQTKMWTRMVQKICKCENKVDNFRKMCQKIVSIIYESLANKITLPSAMTQIYQMLNGCVQTKNKSKDYIIEIIWKYLEEKQGITQQSTTFTDIGGGNGDVLSGLQEHFQGKKEDYHCVETETDWTEINEARHSNIEYMFWKNDHIELPNNSQNVILCMVSLHHMTDDTLAIVMDEMKRILTKDGIVLIKEHDASSKTVVEYIDWEHYLYHIMDQVCTQQPLNVDEYLRKMIHNFKPKETWTEMMEQHGFQSVSTPEYMDRFMFDEWKFDPNNATNMYWQCFKVKALVAAEVAEAAAEEKEEANANDMDVSVSVPVPVSAPAPVSAPVPVSVPVSSKSASNKIKTTRKRKFNSNSNDNNS